MKRRNKKRENRIKRMVVGCGLCAVILTVSTYAWFIGMKTVNVEAFNVKIAAIDGLSLSLDGKSWSDTVTINKDNYELTTEYPGNTNAWSDLVPMSSVGEIDTDASRLILYEKGSFTVTNGGYRIMASRTRNTEADGQESRGYVAFDLFVKNLSGEEYYEDLDPANEEAIYLTPQSEVTVGESGDVRAGIENSVRVGFAQIGRVSAEGSTDADASTKVQAITCAGGGDVTSICSRDAVIWEPNDTKHVQNALNWYKQSCKKRTGADVTEAGSYTSDVCQTINLTDSVTTYAVSGVIDNPTAVDTYDGLNHYTGTTNGPGKDKLMAMDYFTDSEKLKEGNEREELLTLAPNSITKVRIYVWIEGQDIDNYDFASLGGQIEVAFGFTKERFYGEDIEYDGPELPEDVVREETFSYSNTGTVSNISDARATFDDNQNLFTVDKWMKEFTFNDQGNAMRAYKDEDGSWKTEAVVQP